MRFPCHLLMILSQSAWAAGWNTLRYHSVCALWSFFSPACSMRCQSRRQSPTPSANPTMPWQCGDSRSSRTKGGTLRGCMSTDGSGPGSIMLTTRADFEAPHVRKMHIRREKHGDEGTQDESAPFSASVGLHGRWEPLRASSRSRREPQTNLKCPTIYSHSLIRKPHLSGRSGCGTST